MVSTESNIGKWINEPSTLTPADEQWLKEQVDQHPWCFANYALLAKLYTDQNSFLQPKFLKLASVYTSNRNELYNFINDVNQRVAEEDIPTHTSVGSEREGILPTEKPPVLIKAEQEETPQQAEKEIPEEVLEEKPEPEVMDKAGDNTQTDFDEDNELKGEQKSIAVDNKEDELESVGDVPKAKEKVKIDFDEIVKYDPLKELKPLENKRKPKDSIPVDQVVYNPEVELAKLIEDKEEAEESGKQDFIFWLNHLEDEEKEKQPETSAEKVQDLLDKFLATKRKRPIQNREFYNPESKAEKSEEDNMDVISETLAQLYVTQKHYEKAIEAYKKLSLQNPDKSATFAARIKELENSTA